MAEAENQDMKPPVAERDPHVQTLKFTDGTSESWSDDFFYMRNKEDKRTIPYLDAENAYTDARLKDLEQCRKELYDEMLARIVEDDSQAPVKYGEYDFYSRTEKGKPYSIYCRRKGADGEEEIVLDCNKLAEGSEYFRLGAYQLSPDASILCYGVDFTGSERYELRFKNVETKEDFGPKIENAAGPQFDNIGNIYFSRYNDAWRPNQIFRKSYVKEDEPAALVMQEDNERFRLYVSRSRTGRFVYVVSASSISYETHYLSADSTEGLKCVFPRKEKVEYELEDWGDYFYIRTNEDAETFKLQRCLISDPENTIETIIECDPETTIKDVSAFSNFMSIQERGNGLDQIRILSLPNHESYSLEFPDESYLASVGSSKSNPHFDTDVVRFTYESAVIPDSTYDFNMATKERVLVKRLPVNNFNPENYEVRRIVARAYDGEKVPMTMLKRKDVELSADTPLFLDGYGSYGYSNDFFFSSKYYSLVDRGVTCVFTHIRGGGEYGRRWKDNGKLFKKQNTFYDFIACAEHLIFKKYTSASCMVCEGASAGGLLIGAVINARPDLFTGAVMRVPFVDVLNTITDASLPLTAGEWDEWGNPTNTSEEFEYIQRYSPYDNIRRQQYPAILLQSSLNDTRVLYHEPAKYIAKMRLLNPNTDITMKMHMIGGHGGKSGRYGRLLDRAYSFAWILKAFDLVKKAPKL